MKDSVGGLFLINMDPSKWKRQNITFLEKKRTFHTKETYYVELCYNPEMIVRCI